MKLSVIICTHNPRRNYLQQVLVALQIQTLPFSEWEILLVDNASDRLLSNEFDLSWQPNSRNIREEILGLTPARVRGIKESRTDLLVFVDDDNVLDPDFLEQALFISCEWPMVGAWGGQVRPSFETPPPEWTKPYWGYLAIREFDRDYWSNIPRDNESTPYGTGLCVRKSVALEYIKRIQEDSFRAALDRKGNSLISGGDVDLAFTACYVGLGTGRFKNLKMSHLIPASRLEEKYLLKLAEGIAFSQVVITKLGGYEVTEPSFKERIKHYLRRFMLDKRSRRFYDAQNRGRSRAFKEIRGNSFSPSV